MKGGDRTGALLWWVIRDQDVVPNTAHTSSAALTTARGSWHLSPHLGVSSISRPPSHTSIPTLHAASEHACTWGDHLRAYITKTLCFQEELPGEHQDHSLARDARKQSRISSCKKKWKVIHSQRFIRLEEAWQLISPQNKDRLYIILLQNALEKSKHHSHALTKLLQHLETQGTSKACG